MIMNQLKQNKIMKKFLFLLSVAMGLTAFSFTVRNTQEKKPWPVPDNFKTMKNPVASNAESIADGKTLYGTHCKSCHGAKGKGDGTKAATLKTEPGDFSKADFQSQTDGAIFYKTSEGRDDMPKFKAKIPDADDRWSIVNYLRTLK
jgi:mono/diheme cytochrome c family protein